MLWQQRMYTLLLLPIYIPESRWRSALLPVGTRFIFINLASLFSEHNAVPFGFCSGGFSSTAGYVPGNEA
ncbi:MAG: hypothetical protein M3362_17565 [Acidobacteriota bacterium]|nr:hypothetical protein [Acidobacteriota bacterium]